MDAKFIKCQNTIINVNDILSITTHEQYLRIVCKYNVHNIYFQSEQEAQEELDRIYKLIK